jgi:P27 family predicted phage terminase small subunit
MSGPPPTPNVIKLRRGNPGRRPLHGEIQPERLPEPPDCPDFLVGHAADEWHRVAEALHRAGILTVLDIAVLGAYADAYGRWRTAVETLNGMAERDPATHGLLVKRASDGNPMRNPLAALASDAANDMLKFASELGCTAIARARLAGAGFTPSEGGKFDGLLAE